MYKDDVIKFQCDEFLYLDDNSGWSSFKVKETDVQQQAKMFMEQLDKQITK